MNWKQERIGSYQKKKFTNQQKKQQKIQQKKLSEEEQFVIDSLYNASVSQLVEFMEKKYAKVIKHSSKIQEPLNQAITKRINQLPAQFRKIQISKIISTLETKFDGFKVTPSQHYPNFYKVTKSGVFWKSRQINGINNVQGICINYSINLLLSIYFFQTKGNQKLVRICSKHQDYPKVYSYITTDQIAEIRISNVKVNFQRVVNKTLQLYTQFLQNMKSIESNN